MWDNRIVATAEVSPDELLANPKNWRVHPRYQREALAALLDEVGWVKPVTVNRRTNTLLDGHLRVDIALERNQTSIPVQYVELTEEEEDAVLAALDSSTYLAGIDPKKLNGLLDKIQHKQPALNQLADAMRQRLEVRILGGKKDLDGGAIEAYRVRVGAYTFLVDGSRYEHWRDSLLEKHNGDRSAVAKDIQRRLGL